MDKWCNDKQDKLKNFQAAIQKCKNNHECHGIFDHKCDGGVFRQCMSQEAIVDQQEFKKEFSSCVYKKKGTSCLLTSLLRISNLK